MKLETKYLDFELDDTRVVECVTSDRFGLFVAKEWEKLLQPYTPRDTETLLKGVEYKPWEIHYTEPYSHYMYEGYLYVNPKTGSPYAPSGTKKEQTQRLLKYNREKSEYATDHWDIKAAQSGQLDKLYQTLNKELQSGMY